MNAALSSWVDARAADVLVAIVGLIALAIGLRVLVT